ncbi:hypothetical protein AZ34_08930 [Hylemonella gracilis str. Niagara R]|uniref:Protein-arginine rhamnosyltransferase n=1 Tax=Hylemonella gracilis str. Niagara R TaxID=1458275 RepID=A0A016XH74_9BURK|nr:elongation factor P maturation arginine rhamnosyltransferase EarP [Hylemonella gracilis]EYC51196.1 hypothetical protein AZ34_08930 [Hylemonella gracilis str. Niagara R]
MRWDIFCKVIDNHGDIGVCWRLARQIAARGQEARLWVDDASALAWMAPGQIESVEVHPWSGQAPAGLPPGDVLIEAFGCDIAPDWIQAVATADTAWINLEYLSAEPYVERMHGLPSPVLSGPLTGWRKRFFYPGFTPATGGLLREPDLQQRQVGFKREAWLAAQGIWPEDGSQVISLFCYEPDALSSLLAQLARPDAREGQEGQPRTTHLLVTAGRAAAAVQTTLGAQNPNGADDPSRLRIHYLPRLSQDDYDHLLWACDLNFVRGEDSLVRALWAARPGPTGSLQSIPFVWQIYPQHDGAHHVKLQAFLDWMLPQAGDHAGLRAFHAVWNGLHAGALPALAGSSWAEATQGARARLLAQTDLCTQLQAMAEAT